MSNLARAMSLVTVLVAAGCGGNATGPNGPESASALLAVAPAGDATNVNRMGPMTMTFDGAMGTGMEQYVDLHHGDLSGPLHPMTCTWSADRSVLTCVPTSPMDPDDMYTLHMGGGMRGAQGGAVNMGRGSTMGGHTIQGNMMNGSHAGQPMSMMGSGWRGADGSYGMMFQFHTGS